MDFNAIAERYEKVAKLQSSAGEILLSILEIKRNESVLDVGCGNGLLTAKLRKLTDGRVVGIDASEKMIEVAKKKFGEKIEFYVMRAEEMEFENEFDVVFSNSAFQWFNVKKALKRIHTALKSGGRVGIQAPATDNYCPTFLKAIEEVMKSDIYETFKYFRSPWVFFNSEEEYIEVFEKFGFKVNFCKIEKIITRHSIEEAFKIFESGAVAAYLNPKFYNLNKLDESYIKKFKDVVKNSFKKQSKDGFLNIEFNRVFLIAEVLK